MAELFLTMETLGSISRVQNVILTSCREGEVLPLGLGMAAHHYCLSTVEARWWTESSVFLELPLPTPTPACFFSAQHLSLIREVSNGICDPEIGLELRP